MNKRITSTLLTLAMAALLAGCETTPQPPPTPPPDTTEGEDDWVGDGDIDTGAPTIQLDDPCGYYPDFNAEIDLGYTGYDVVPPWYHKMGDHLMASDGSKWYQLRIVGMCDEWTDEAGNKYHRTLETILDQTQRPCFVQH